MLQLATLLTHELNLVLAITGLILLLGLVLKFLKQPYIIAYILSGLILGPSGMNMVQDQKLVASIGEFGLIILLFFIGTEISIHDFLKRWRVALFGTGMQIILSIGLAFLISMLTWWLWPQVVLIGFVISLSSSAVVIKLIEDFGLSQVTIGKNVISVLLTQDVLIAPMIIIISFLGGQTASAEIVIKQIIGGILITTIMILLLKNRRIRLPFQRLINQDHELQVFAGVMVCLGMAFVISYLELSAGLGAFVAGLMIHATPACGWLHSSLHSFRVLLVSLFFLSVGMMIDLSFLLDNPMLVGLLVAAALITNHGINTISFRVLGHSWRHSLLGGSLLAQIGEFSFVLASIGFQTGLLEEYGYQILLITISLSLLISPLWVSMTKRIVRI